MISRRPSPTPPLSRHLGTLRQLGMTRKLFRSQELAPQLEKKKNSGRFHGGCGVPGVGHHHHSFPLFAYVCLSLSESDGVITTELN
ncbi:hypothetical protein E2562_022738 [Oryza meyeriana var. granulata]|uniref:Uncharacterized protein n=1 Tax=Oryza meyeriana var. granulata TaxID=110450 RepID=A0A6G1FBA9_9ORYZ|nr:hypothetical protein E2562_022738 [Oryza meyeriana var. granulata]